MKEFLVRFRSPALWTAMAALGVFCLREFYGVDLSGSMSAFMDVLLPVLVAFGIVNNPTNKSGI